MRPRLLWCCSSLSIAVAAACGSARQLGDAGQTVDASSGTDGGAVDACPQYSTGELFEIETAVKNAAAAVAATLDECTLDSDCMNAGIQTGCLSGCCVSINAANAAAYREAEKGISGEHCPKPPDGCGVPVNNADCWCNESKCVAGHCVNASAPGLHRVPVEGTQGFCASYGQAAATCATVDDCVGYRVPVDFDCCTGIVSEPDCRLADKEQIAPGQVECAADKACDAYPRACLDGQCVFTIPDRACTADVDCETIDTECGCLAASAQADPAALIFGSACQAGVVCEDAGVACIDGTCRLFGAFMDDPIARYCEKAAECSLLGEVTEAECVGMYKNDYLGASSYWLMISAAGIVGTHCGLGGPWDKMVLCPYVLCP